MKYEKFANKQQIWDQLDKPDLVFGTTNLLTLIELEYNDTVQIKTFRNSLKTVSE